MTRKIIDGARSGLNSLLDKVSADDTPLTGVERGELDAELERRAKARAEAGGARAASDNPRARYAGAGDEAARRRREAAEAREKRHRSGKQAKKEAEEKAREAAWQKFQAEARRAPPPGPGPGPGPGAPGGSSSGPKRPFPGGLGKDDKIAKHYKTLDLPYGADFDQVKAAYRKLMRKYHPDLHGQTPQKQKAATELTMQVTQAYNELEAHLTKK